MHDIFLHNAVAWMGTRAQILKMEDLVRAVRNLDSDEAEQYFRTTLGYCGISTLPPDWRKRVLIGSDRKQSATARENLAGQSNDVPEVLPDTQKALVDLALPGLRKLLGYC